MFIPVNAASGEITGLAAGVTCGASLVVTAAVIGITAVAGNAVGQAITKGSFDKINYEDALLEGTIAVWRIEVCIRIGSTRTLQSTNRNVGD